MKQPEKGSPDTKGGENGQDVRIAGESNLPQLFCQMDVLYHFIDGDMEWRETARWIKYEERVEVGQRWSKPYVATLSLHALFEFRSCISDGVVILDTALTDIQSVYEELVGELGRMRKLTVDTRQKILHILLRPHKHQHRKGINKKPYKGKLAFWPEPACLNGSTPSSLDQSTDSLNRFPFPSLPKDGTVVLPDPKKFKPNKKFVKKVPKDAEAANILVGEVNFLSHPVMAFIRLYDPSVLGHVTEVRIPTKFMFLLLGPPEHHSIWEYEEVGRAAASLLTDKVFCSIAHQADDRKALLAGIDEYIDDLTVLPPSIWDPSTRLEPPSKTADPQSTLRAKRRLASRERHVTLPQNVSDDDEDDDDEEEEKDIEEDKTLQRTGSLFGGMVADIRRRYRYYLSDVTDALALQSLASVVFLYFACITPIVTFGGLMGSATDNYVGTIESIMSGALCGITYHLFAGQPLTIVGATGPLLVFETLVYNICIQYGFDFLGFRFWIGMWCALMLLAMVAFDLSALVRYITRFTEESFSVLISLIFIYEAFSKQFHTLDKSPVHIKTIHEMNHTCHCLPQTCGVNASLTCLANTSSPDPVPTWAAVIDNDCININDQVIIRHDCISEDQCAKYGGMLMGPACHDAHVTQGVPDVFFFSLFLFLGTFSLAWVLANSRNSRFFPSIVRTMVADFAVVISVVVATGIDLYVGLNTAKLPVPEDVKPSRPDRGWIINPMVLTPWWLALVAALPALLATILIFLDQQITAVIVNRKEHKLKKGHGYHLDLFVVAVLIGVCSALGLPWFVAATVRTITHVRSLMKQSETAAPGEKPVFHGVREQRVTGVLIHVLIGVSVLFTVVLKKIPMSVLYGVFLYMGIASLRGVQFVQRILLPFMPQKYQPDYVYLRHVRTVRVHAFTLVQVICMGIMWAIKMIDTVAIAFPLVILALCAVRKIMSYVFTSSELEWLDDLSPEEQRRAREDRMQGKEAGEHLTDAPEDTTPRERKASVHSFNVNTDSQPPMERKASVHSFHMNVDGMETWRHLGNAEDALAPSVELPRLASLKELKNEMHQSGERPQHLQLPKPSSMTDMGTSQPRPTHTGPLDAPQRAVFQPLGTGSAENSHPDLPSIRGNTVNGDVTHNTRV